MEILLGYLAIALVMGGIAEMIRDGAFWWGFFLGFIGWIIAAATRHQKKNAQETAKLRKEIANLNKQK